MRGLSDKDWNDLGKLAWTRARVSLKVMGGDAWNELPIDEQHLWTELARAVFREGLMRTINLLTAEEAHH